MKFFFGLALVVISQASLQNLIDQTLHAKQKLMAQASIVENELKDVIGQPKYKPASSLVQTMSELATERAALEKHRKEVLQKDALEMEAKKQVYRKSIDKLKFDAAQRKPFSLIQQSEDGRDIKSFFEPAREALVKVHSVVQSIVEPAAGEDSPSGPSPQHERASSEGLDVELD